MAPLHLTVTLPEQGMRLDQFVARRAACSRAEAQRLIASGEVLVAGAQATKGRLLLAGDAVTLRTAPAGRAERRVVAEPELPLEVLYLDEALLGVAKPPQMPTHPLRAGERGTLANAIVARFAECAEVADDPREGGVAHRLDLDTSGVVLAARSRAAWLALRSAFARGQVAKEYWALVAGDPPAHGEIDAPIIHQSRRRVAVNPAGQPARTSFTVLARRGGLALVQAESRTGRMHQIRVHLAHVGFPLVGDALYGGPALAGVVGHFLHARRLVCAHPADLTTHRPLEVVAPLPKERAQLLSDLLGWY